MKTAVKNLLDECLKRYPELSLCSNAVIEAFEAIRSCYAHGGKVLACGNGGSASDAEHIVGELMKKFSIKRVAPQRLKDRLDALGYSDSDKLCSMLEPALPAISLVSQSSVLTAIANDTGAEMIFAQQVYGLGKPGDVLIALSTSGNSPNIISAIKIANALDMVTIGFTGETGGIMKSLCSVIVTVPSPVTFKIQELHLPVYHLLCAMIEEEFFGGTADK